MNYFNRLLSEDGAIAGAGMEVRDIAELGMGVLLPSMGEVPASSSSLAGKGFWQELWQAQSPVIALAG